MRGKIGTTIDIAIRREGAEEPLRFSLIRERIHQRAVGDGVLSVPGSATWHDDGAGERAEELAQEVERLINEGMRALVLDLRSNPGGLRDEAVESADLFLDPRQDILVSRGRAPGTTIAGWTAGPQRWRMAADRRARQPRAPRARRRSSPARSRITTARSSSATRPTARESCRRVFPLGPKVALRITTARWYTPSGRSIQGAVLDSVMGAAARAGPQTTYRSERRTARSPAGGGIVPDVVLGPDTLTQRASSALPGRSSGQIPAFRDVADGVRTRAPRLATARSRARTSR